VEVDQVDPSLNQAERWRFWAPPALRLPRKNRTTDFGRKSATAGPQWLWPHHGPGQGEMARFRQVQATTEDARSRLRDDSMSATPVLHPPAADPSRPKRRRNVPGRFEDEDFPFGAEYWPQQLREIQLRREPHPRRPDPPPSPGKGLRVRASELCSSCGKDASAALPKASNHTWAPLPRQARAAQGESATVHVRSSTSRGAAFSPTGAQTSGMRPDSPPSWGPCTLGCATAFGGKVDVTAVRRCRGRPQPGSPATAKPSSTWFECSVPAKV